jgi:putative tricarboxylic transport membrane protein
MDIFHHTMSGFAVALQPVNIMAALLGALVGTATGVLPGLGVLGAMAILMPITLHFSAVTGLIMLSGIYYGAMYGGSTTAILLKIPGESGSIVTTIDGYEFARKGRAGAALMICAVGSFVAGTISIVGLSLFTPLLTDVALKFSSPEFCALSALGAITLVRITGRDPSKNMLMLAIGVALATVGVDAVGGNTRFSFGTESLALGFDLVPVALGLYGMTELFQVLISKEGFPRAESVRLRDMVPTRAEWRRAWPAIVRGSGIGFLIGLLPGPGSLTSTFASYGVERALAREHKAEFGKGAVEGFAGPEAANNAVSTSALVPVLSLGIPFTPNVALLLGALIVQGIQPGPLLLSQHPDIVWGLLASMYIGNVALLILNLPLVGLWVRLLHVPQYILISGIFVISIIGTYTLRSSIWDLIVLFCSGLIGFIFRRLEFDMAPLVLGIVLGPIFEKSLRETLFLSGGDLGIFLERPISATIVGLCVMALVAPSVFSWIKRRGTVGERVPAA